MLVLPNKDVWTFDSHEDRVELEESVYLGGSEGPRRTVQIVIHGRARQVPRVHWTFTHTPRQPRRKRRATPPPSARRRTSRNCRSDPYLPLQGGGRLPYAVRHRVGVHVLLRASCR